MEEPIYEDTVTRTHINPSSLSYIMAQIRETHSLDAGWVVGEPVIPGKNADGTIDLYVSLKQYSAEKIMEKPMCEDILTRTYVDPSSLSYIMNQIREVHSLDAGWAVGEPVIFGKNADGTIDFYVPVKQYSAEKISERSL